MQNLKNVTNRTDGHLVFANDVALISGDAAPTDGTSGTGVGYAGPGSIYIRINAGNAKMYINGGAGTKASPVWKLVTSAA
jgi:hypothetical protein